ncbi:VOC family protein [Demequina flava]|uniref:VOC family protein n=1 Tax=Demequina flava TaxID=1095025 RepID=UPI000782A3E8|nr:VOC family protein [Demequina flava]
MADADHPHVHHAPDYIEIPATDIEASGQFYQAAFGWELTAYGPGYRGIVAADGREHGGISEVESVTPGGALIVMYSDDLRATRQAVLDAGGLISHDIFDFPGGQRFHFIDPCGLEMAVWALP